MPGPAEFRGKLIKRAIGAGKLDMSDIKDRARNVLELIEKTRPLQLPEEAPEGENDSPESRDVNRRAATEGIVLLKNYLNVLPVNKPGRVAVIGPNATAKLFCGGGSSTLFPYYYVSPLDGIKEAVSKLNPASEVVFSHGCFKYQQLPVAETEAEPGRKGLKLEFFDKNFQESQNANKVGELYSDTAYLLFFDCLPKEVGPVPYTRGTGIFKAPATGSFEFSLITTGRAKFYLDKNLIINNWDAQQKGESVFGMNESQLS